MKHLRSFLLTLGACLHFTPGVLAQTDAGLQRAGERQEIQAAKLSKVPKQIRFVKADYPKAAEEQGIEAEVVLLLDISAEGKVEAVGIVEPATPAGMGFDEAAMVAAQQFEFEPAELDGKPVAVQLSYRYRFTLAPKAESEPAAKPGARDAESSPAEPAAAEDRGPAAPGTVNLRGVLLERGTRLPMAGVILTVFRDDGPAPVGFEATADERGRFQFVDLDPGVWKVLVDAPGYYPYRTSETIVAGERVDAKYYVERGTYNPFDVTVTAIRPKKEVSRTVITAKEAERVPGGIGDPLAVLQNFAGVARTESSALLVVRGSDPADSMTLVEGTYVPSLYHFGALRTVVPAGVLDTIEFYPGNFSPEYGNATGGVVDVRLKKLEPKKIGGYADISIIDTSVYLEAPIGKKAAVAVAGRRSYIDVLLNAILPDDIGLQMITAPRYYDYQVLGNYRPTRAHNLQAMFFGSDDRMEFLFENPAEIDPSATEGDVGMSTTFYRLVALDEYVPNERFNNRLTLSLGRDLQSMDMMQFQVDLEFLTAEVREKAHYAFDDHFAVNVGFDASETYARVKLDMPRMSTDEAMTGRSERTEITDVVTDEFDDDAWYGGVFAEAEFTPGAGFLLVPGIRVERYGLTRKGSVQPRLTGRWEFIDRWSLKGGLGLFELEPRYLETNDSFGNPDLDPERAIHYSAGLEHKLTDQLSVDGTFFYKRLTSLATPTDRMVERDGEVVPLNYDNGGSGRVRGLELVVRQELWKGLSGWVAYTLSQSKRLDPGQTEEELFDWDQTHVLNVVAGYALPRNWLISSRFRMSTGKPMTPVVGAVFDASRDEYRATYGERSSDRLRTFHQLDLRVDKRWIYRSWILGAYIDIQNVYNRTNTEDVNYNYNYRESRRAPGVPLFPIVGVRGEL
ncbi:MAG: TonB-dependent receptor [Polyangiaceae bacterium]|nr:TonB-dependent receptor [Polyangiaceae bacterium]